MIVTTRFGPEAADLYSQIHALCFQPGWGEAEFVRLLSSSGVAGLIARNGETPVGMALIRTVAGDCEILTLGAVPDARRSGVGAALLHGAEDAARSSGARRMFLEVSVENAPAAALYDRAGYREAGRRKAYYRNGVDARVLSKALV